MIKITVATDFQLDFFFTFHEMTIKNERILTGFSKSCESMYELKILTSFLYNLIYSVHICDPYANAVVLAYGSVIAFQFLLVPSLGLEFG
jgi:hypothetical protein